MGHVYVQARVSARRGASVRLLVDTGATYTIVPPQLVRRVGASLLPRRFAVSLANGTSRRLYACSIGIRVGGRAGPTTALILPGGEPLLDVETLEALGLRVNPERRRLEPSRRRAALLVGLRLRRPSNR